MSEFSPSESKTAIVPMTNPTLRAFDYVADLYMGTNLALMAETPFHLEAEESKDISLPVVMPSAAGTYPVHIGVFSGGVNIALYRAAEDVVIVPVGVAEFVYVSGIRYYPLYYYPPGYIHSTSVRLEIDVQNVGNAAGVCSVRMYDRWHFVKGSYSRWYGWYLLDYDPRHRPSVRFWKAELAPGEIVTFYGEGEIARGYYITEREFKVTGTPGEIIRTGIPGKIWTD